MTGTNENTLTGDVDDLSGYSVNLVGKTRWRVGPTVRLDTFADEFRRWTIGAYYGLPQVPLRVMVDTDDLSFVHAHRCGRRVRHKVRIRHYPEQIRSRDLTYLFIVIGLGIINGASGTAVSLAETLVVNGVVVGLTALLELGFRGHSEHATPGTTVTRALELRRLVTANSPRLRPAPQACE